MQRDSDITNLQFDGVGLPLEYTSQYGDIDMALYDRVEVLRGADGLNAETGNPSATVNFIRNVGATYDLTRQITAYASFTKIFNPQYQSNIATDAGFNPSTAQDYYSGGNATLQGIEAEISGQITHDWNVSAGGTILRVTDDSGQSPQLHVPQKSVPRSTLWRVTT